MPDDPERWRSIIAAAASRREARDALGCSFHDLKTFRAEHMPDHSWPDSRTASERRKSIEATRRKRKNREP